MDLFPQITPYNTGYLPVSGGHSIYYEECGNPEGTPAFIVHGGPGVGCDEKDRRFLDPQKYRIVLFDQRGSNRSKPFGKIEFNTIEHLAMDMWWLRRHLNIKKMLLFGGSWGTTLSLYYAIRFPSDVLGMILRGIFLGTKEEIDFIYKGGNGLFYPEAWERFLANVPENRHADILGYFYERMLSGTKEEKTKFAFEMSRFEEALLHLEPQPDKNVDQETQDCPYAALGLLEAHYFMNDCFMADGLILNNIKHIPNVPISIIQGQYDMVCPPLYAYRLRRALEYTKHNQVAWNLALAGHSKSDKAIKEKLLEEGDRIHALLVQ